MDKMTEKVISKFAAYATPSSAYRELREEYGEQSLTAGQVKTIRDKYRARILEERKKLMAKIPILDSVERFAYLQDIVDGALEPQVVYDPRSGVPVKAVIDRQVALGALKLAHDMTQLQGVLNTDDEDLVKSLVTEAYETMKQETPNRPDQEILAEILETLGQRVQPYITQIQQETTQNAQI